MRRAGFAVRRILFLGSFDMWGERFLLLWMKRVGGKMFVFPPVFRKEQWQRIPEPIPRRLPCVLLLYP
jgi:hypothetical protein